MPPPDMDCRQVFGKHGTTLFIFLCIVLGSVKHDLLKLFNFYLYLIYAIYAG
jgi:hypothetical protein